MDNPIGAILGLGFGVLFLLVLIRYLWIDEISKTQYQIIYVPTETSLSILEASRNKIAAAKE